MLSRRKYSVLCHQENFFLRLFIFVLGFVVKCVSKLYLFCFFLSTLFQITLKSPKQKNGKSYCMLKEKIIRFRSAIKDVIISSFCSSSIRKFRRRIFLLVVYEEICICGFHSIIAIEFEKPSLFPDS